MSAIAVSVTSIRVRSTDIAVMGSSWCRCALSRAAEVIVAEAEVTRGCPDLAARKRISVEGELAMPNDGLVERSG
jgi:hypothetical protein